MRCLSRLATFCRVRGSWKRIASAGSSFNTLTTAPGKKSSTRQHRSWQQASGELCSGAFRESGLETSQ